MDITIVLMWVIVLLILHLFVEKSLQMKKIAESFMNSGQMRTTLGQDIKAMSASVPDDIESNVNERQQKEESMESDLLNFLMNGDMELNKQMGGEDKMPDAVSGEFNLINHTNVVSEKVMLPNDKRNRLNSGKFANLNTFDSISAEGSEQYSMPM